MHEKIKIPIVIKWWLGSKLPSAYLVPPIEKMIPGSRKTLMMVRHYLVHPIKRRVAKYYLLFLKRFCGIKVIAITGSAGKTTTKEMIYAIMQKKGKTIASVANIDPIFNIPTTILRCRPSTKYVVMEMGVEYPGEMDFYLWLAKPDVGVLTNIYPTHVLYLKNIEGVKKEKAKLIKSLSVEGLAILNSDDEMTKGIESETKARVIYYGSTGTVKAENAVINSKMTTDFDLIIDKNKINTQLPILGLQFVQNALAAAAASYSLGVSIKAIRLGLKTYSMPEHRMKIIPYGKSIIIDDSYNNNPKAAESAIKSLMLINNKHKAVIFGDMLELGKTEVDFHKQIGELIGKEGVEFLVGVGKLAKYTVNSASKYIKNKDLTHWVEKPSDAFSIVQPLFNQNYAILIKGSRSIGLDSLVHQLSSQ